MRSSPPQFDREKLKEAVWLVANHCPSEDLGSVKLHKILYFADMLRFVMVGRPITGEEYQKQKFGPTARHLAAAVRSLQQEGRVRVEERQFFGFWKKAYVPLQPYAASRLSDDEQRLLIEIADLVRGHSARSISDLSHDAIWEMAEMGETLPYFSALRMGPEEATEDDIAWALETARADAAAGYR